MRARTLKHVSEFFDNALWKSAPFFLISGPNVVESEAHLLHTARSVYAITTEIGLPLLFKSSFDKANRTTRGAFRGIGIDKGLEALQCVKDALHVPIVTDIHEPWQADIVSQVADVLQIPAFLCRQTDLLEAAGRTGKCVMIKKGQFASVEVMEGAIGKVESKLVMVCERGTTFGYSDLVVDYRNLVRLRQETDAVVVFDATHATQHPPSSPPLPSFDLTPLHVTSGNVRMVSPLARAAVAVGIDGLFLEVHNDPSTAPVEKHTQIPLHNLGNLLHNLKAIANLTTPPPSHNPVESHNSIETSSGDESKTFSNTDPSKGNQPQ